MRRLLNGATWNADDIHDNLQTQAADKLGEDGGVLILNDTGFAENSTISAGAQRRHFGTADHTENHQIGVFAAHTTTRDRALADCEPARVRPPHPAQRLLATQHLP